MVSTCGYKTNTIVTFANNTLQSNVVSTFSLLSLANECVLATYFYVVNWTLLVNTTHCVCCFNTIFICYLRFITTTLFFVKLTISFLQWYIYNIYIYNIYIIYIVVAELPQLVLGCKDSQVNLWTDVAFLWRVRASAKCGCRNFVMKLSLERRKQMALVNYSSLHITALSTSVCCWSITSLGSSPPSTPLWYMGPQANERPPH